jgi:hypothetical protein
MITLLMHRLGVPLVRVHRVRLSSLKLEQERWVFDFDQIVDILEPCLHELNLRLDSIVSICDRSPHRLFGTSHEFTRQQLNELVLNILDEIEFGLAMMVHDEYSEEAVWVFDARIGHFDEYIGVFLKIDH